MQLGFKWNTECEFGTLPAVLAILIDRIDRFSQLQTDVIEWACPVPSFGPLLGARVATLGINPSNREFVDEFGSVLGRSRQRLPTLASLGLDSWSRVDAEHLKVIIDACQSYFAVRPYGAWFDRLDDLLRAIDVSYYDSSYGACHLDLIPYATSRKWAQLPSKQRQQLLHGCSDVLGLLLRDSRIRLLILNGRSVLHRFEEMAGIKLQASEMVAWSLPRSKRTPVPGFAYSASVDCIAGIHLSHPLLVLGFNHNLQSSYGVSREVVREMRMWVAEAAKDAL